jgi:hypothetical protein
MASMVTRVLQTIYHGQLFRSRTEARWAVFFDACGILYEYEKEGYDLSGIEVPGNAIFDYEHNAYMPVVKTMPNGTCYLPDFWLPQVSLRSSKSDGLWFEVKGREPTDHELELASALVLCTGDPVIIAVGPPEEDKKRMYEITKESWDNYMQFMKCTYCGHVKVEFLEGSYMYCRCGDGLNPSSNEHPSIVNAIQVSNTFRFR